MITEKTTDLEKWNTKWEKASPEEILKEAFELIPGEKVISLSMQLEDNVLLHMILAQKLPVRAYTLDTGRMHKETHQMMDNLRFKYDIPLEVYYPDTAAVEALTSSKGMFSFKESVENRKECCRIRKVEPNLRALKGASLWVNGIRRDQSEERKNTPVIEFDPALQIYRLSPLVNKTWPEVHRYAKENKVPIHKLYEQGFTSIGCEPCTRAIEPGEDSRAGRWWWENGNQECGLHVR